MDGMWRVKERMMEEKHWAGLDLSDLGGCCKFDGKIKGHSEASGML